MNRPVTVALVATLAIAAFATWAYAPVARRDGDLGLARGALEGLTFVGQAASIGTGSSNDYSNALEDHYHAVDLLLHSDARRRLGEVAGAIDDSWLAYLVADELWRLQEQGIDRPLVSQVYGADRLLVAFPGLAGRVTGTGAEARIDDRGSAAMRAVFAFGRERREAAASALEAEERRP